LPLVGRPKGSCTDRKKNQNLVRINVVIVNPRRWEGLWLRMQSDLGFEHRQDTAPRPGRFGPQNGLKHDVYLACRALKGELKASLHQSGNWHIAFSKKSYKNGFADESNRPDSRFTDVWPRPPEIAPGITLAFRIVVPWFSATVDVAEEEANVILVPPALEGHAIEFAILITSPTCIVSDWPAKRSMGSKLVGSILLASGETVWVVYTTMPIQIPPSMRGTARFFKGVDRSTLKSPGLRTIAFGEESDGSRVMYDVPVLAECDNDR